MLNPGSLSVFIFLSEVSFHFSFEAGISFVICLTHSSWKFLLIHACEILYIY